MPHQGGPDYLGGAEGRLLTGLDGGWWGEGHRMGAGSESQPRDGRTSLPSEVTWEEEDRGKYPCSGEGVYGFLLLSHEHRRKRLTMNRCPGEKSRNWKFLWLQNSTPAPPHPHSRKLDLHA